MEIKTNQATQEEEVANQQSLEDEEQEVNSQTEDLNDASPDATQSDEKSKDCEKELSSPNPVHERIVARKNISYSCRTTCRNDVVIITCMKDGSEDTLTFVCHLKW